jgi:hypothetical protein
MTAIAHDMVPLHETALNCRHPEPARDGAGWGAWDNDHPAVNGTRMCVLTDAGWCCLACTAYAREHHGLPSTGFVTERECTAQVSAG